MILLIITWTDSIFTGGYFDKIPVVSKKAKRHVKVLAIRMTFYYVLSRLTHEYPIITGIEG